MRLARVRCEHPPLCSANTDDMYARFLAGPESIAKARRSDSATSNDALAAKQAEANPYATFSGISAAGLQSSVFQAPVCSRGLGII